MTHIPKARKNKLSAKTCGNKSSPYLVTKALQILSYIHYIVYE